MFIAVVVHEAYIRTTSGAEIMYLSLRVVRSYRRANTVPVSHHLRP